MEGQELELFREKLEDEFKSLLNNGDDVRSFLYFPYNYLTKFVKDHLDELLMVEAYNWIEKGRTTPEDFLVYQDNLITVKLEKTEQQVEMLERLIEYYSSLEEFEKCAKVQQLLKKLNNY